MRPAVAARDRSRPGATSLRAPRTSPVPPPPPAAAAAGTLAPKPAGGETPESRLFVGVTLSPRASRFRLRCAVIEGQVEATVNSTAMEIAKPGTLRGTADRNGGDPRRVRRELTARTRLIVHGTGRVSGTIRYGKLIVEEGGEVVGESSAWTADATGVPHSRRRRGLAERGGAGGPTGPLVPSAERWSN